MVAAGWKHWNIFCPKSVTYWLTSVGLCPNRVTYWLTCPICVTYWLTCPICVTYWLTLCPNSVTYWLTCPKSVTYWLTLCPKSVTYWLTVKSVTDIRTYGVTMRGEGLSCYVQLKSMTIFFSVSSLSMALDLCRFRLKIFNLMQLRFRATYLIRLASWPSQWFSSESHFDSPYNLHYWHFIM